jgi:hypothetical protein
MLKQITIFINVNNTNPTRITAESVKEVENYSQQSRSSCRSPFYHRFPVPSTKTENFKRQQLKYGKSIYACSKLAQKKIKSYS